MNKIILFVVALLLAFGLGILSYASWQKSKDQQRSEQQASVLLERVREVCKLVTIEGDLSEIYDETMSREVTLYLPLPTKFSFDKQATVQLTGKVLVGYDLEKIDLDLNASARTLTISGLPAPEILAIEHELQYRNISESWFNSFTPADYTALQKSAKAFLREKALESDLLQRANEQGLGMLNTIRLLAETAGYELVVLTQEQSTKG